MTMWSCQAVGDVSSENHISQSKWISRQEIGSVVRATMSIVLALAVITVPAIADEAVLSFSRSVELPALTEESLIAIRLDSGVYAATQDDLNDVRLLDAREQPVPFLLRKRQTKRSRSERISWVAHNLSVQPLEQGGLEITIALDKDEPQPTGLRLISPLINFEQRVRVETSADGAAWEPAGAEAVIFDYSRFMDVRSDGLAFAQTNRRHFRIMIDNVTSEQQSQLVELTRRLQGEKEVGRTERRLVDRRPFRIDRIEFFREVDRARAVGTEYSNYPVASFKVKESAVDKETIITVETRREPLTSFAIETSSRNFSRRVRVKVEDVDGVIRRWRSIGEKSLSRIDFASMYREELQISFPETRQKTYRIIIENRDSPVLKIDGVRAEGIVHEIVTLAQPAAVYALAYADEKAVAPHYDVAALQTLIDSGIKPLQVGLGSEQTIPASGKARPASWDEFVNSPALLISLVVILVIALGWGLYLAARRVDSLPNDGGV